MDLRSAVERCRADPPVLAELREVYARADAAVAVAGVVCLGGGVCCRFDLFGHRLYLSVVELALLTSQPPPRAPTSARRCPYQVGPACTARGRRPLGCRVFFCVEERKLLPPDLPEELHRRIRGIHQKHCIPYAYGEITRFLLQFYNCK